MTEATIWWLIAGATVVAELLTGTFFLLMISIGLATAALAAQAGASLVAQILVAAVSGGGAVVAWYLVKKRHKADPPDPNNPAMNLDVGETVVVQNWLADGTANVKYRGANWTAIRRPGTEPALGPHRVADVVGNRLLIDRL